MDNSEIAFAYKAFMNTDTAKCWVDLNGIIKIANNAMGKLLGIEPENLKNQSIDKWFDKDSLIVPALNAAKVGKNSIGFSNLITSKKTFWMRVHVTPDTSHDNSATGAIISAHDNSAEKRAEIAEGQIERDRAIMDSLSTICHTIGQPATVVMSCLEFLKMGLPDSEQNKEMLEMGYDAILELRELLQQLNEKRHFITQPYIPGSDDGSSILKINSRTY